jgi:alpha-galactosidase
MVRIGFLALLTLVCGGIGLASNVEITHEGNACPVIRTKTSEFEVLPSGYVIARFGKTLDDPGAQSATSVSVNGREIRDFRLDCAHARIAAATGRLGGAGKRVEMIARSATLSSLEEELAFEVYEDLPNVLLMTAAFRNTGAADLSIKQVTIQKHRFSAANADAQVAPYTMWSFQGSSEEWGKDVILPLTANFSRTNPIQQLTFSSEGAGAAGGGIPVLAFWTRDVGEALGQVDTVPSSLDMPVRTAHDGRIEAAIALSSPMMLRHGETYSAPTTFLSIFHGDYYDALRLYSTMLKWQGWAPAHPVEADYEANWCSWGYQLQFTPAQVIGTIPKLQEFGFHWATLDAGWYDNRGDWNPRSDIGESGIRHIVHAFHEAAMRITLWWIPLAVEDGGKDVLDGRPYHFADIAKEHPEWLILDKQGKPARMAGGFAALCPAVPDVCEYYKQLTRRFIRDWGFDGNKLDFSYTVPPCYNPAHHHKSPRDSTAAMGDVYKVIFQTTRALKPESVTQVCPCGTTPNIAWLANLDQAVTADPVGSAQVRRRIKMYKALLGDQAAVYGDHVELTRLIGRNVQEQDVGRDFASTVGTGGVVGTKFTWPVNSSPFADVRLTPAKDVLWKKWVTIYQHKMLSTGIFRNLYIYGYDSPEGYTIEKDGRMYYAFYTDNPQPLTERLELRGLGSGRFHIRDYENGKDYGTVAGPRANLTASFAEHLLLEADR